MKAALGGVLWLAAFGVAGAQPPVGGDEEVVITAPLSVRSELLQSASSIKREAIAATLGAGLGDTLDRTPGVASSAFGAGASRPIIRGLGEDRVRVLSNGLGQIDASSISPDHAVVAEALEAARIEVLRGPAALAYGGNAIGGVVNVLDERIAETLPAQDLSGEALGAVAGGLNSAEASAGVTGAFGPLVLRLEGFVRNAGDYSIPGYGLSAAKRDELIGEGLDAATFARGEAPNSFAQARQAAMGLSYVGDGFFVGVSHKRLTSLYGIPEAPEKRDPLAPQPIFAGPRIDMVSRRTDMRGGWKPGGHIESVRASLAHADYTHTEFEPSGEAGTTFTSKGYEARAELIHRAVLGFKGVVGVSGFAVDFAALGEEAFIAETTTRNAGLFVIERRDLGAIAIESGLRYERDTLETAAFGDRGFDLVSGSLGLSWKPADGLFVGLTLGHAERAPTQVELYANAGGGLIPHAATASIEIGDLALAKEKADTIEAIARWTRGPVSVEGALYHARFDGFIAALDTGFENDDTPIYQYAQSDAAFRGGELTARLDLLRTDDRALSIDIGADYVRANFAGGNNVPRIPPASVTLGADGMLGRWSGRVEWARTASADHLASFETPTAGADIVNARLFWRPVAESDRLVILLDGRNLTDAEARVHSSFVKELLPRPGRSLRLALMARF